MTESQPLASSKQVAEYLGLTPNALAKLRVTGDGPAFIRVGPRQIKYKWSAIEEWINARTHTSTDDYYEVTA